MITWAEKYFSDRGNTWTHVDEIHLWLEQLPGEVKHFSMIPLGTLVVAVAGYEPLDKKAYVEYLMPELVETRTDDDDLAFEREIASD